MSKAYTNGNLTVSDSDYNLTVKVVKHELWPVSYIDDSGKQVDTVWTFEPGGSEFHVGEVFYVETLHPIDLLPEAKASKIARMEAALEALRDA